MLVLLQVIPKCTISTVPRGTGVLLFYYQYRYLIKQHECMTKKPRTLVPNGYRYQYKHQYQCTGSLLQSSICVLRMSSSTSAGIYDTGTPYILGPVPGKLECGARVPSRPWSCRYRQHLLVKPAWTHCQYRYTCTRVLEYVHVYRYAQYAIRTVHVLVLFE